MRRTKCSHSTQKNQPSLSVCPSYSPHSLVILTLLSRPVRPPSISSLSSRASPPTFEFESTALNKKLILNVIAAPRNWLSNGRIQKLVLAARFLRGPQCYVYSVSSYLLHASFSLSRWWGCAVLHRYIRHAIRIAISKLSLHNLLFIE